MKKDKGKIINQSISEIRYLPNQRFFDHRGIILDKLQKSLNYPHWQIMRNRVNLYDVEKLEESKEIAFVSFNNFGYSSYNPPTDNYFKEKGVKFLKGLLEIEEFEYKKIIRFGIKRTFIKSYNNSFEELIDIFEKKFISLSKEFKDALSGDIIDIGIPIYFKKGNEYFNIICGPMKIEQSKEIFRFKDNLPDLGIFFDIDYFKKDMGEIKKEKIIETFESFCKKSIDRFYNTLELLD